MSEATNENVETVKVAIDSKQQKTVRIDPERCLAVINPRSLEELEWQSILKPIVDERGVIIDNLLVWQPDPDDEVWEKLGFKEMSIEDRKLHFILVRGHRRARGACHIKTSPTKYAADIVANVQTVPATILRGITLDRAEELALDDEAKKTLKKWEAVKVVLKRLRKDHSYQEIATSMPQLLYRAFRSNGESLFSEVSRLDNGAERNKKIIADLRNGLDTWVRTAYHIGPAFEEQLLFHFKTREDKRPLLEGQRLLLDCKRQNVTALQKVYNTSRNDSWTPVTNIDWPEDSMEPVIEGGNEEVRAWIKQKMKEYRDPEVKPDEPKMPNKSDRDSVRTTNRSAAAKLAAAFFCGLPSEGRIEADELSYFREEREKVRDVIFNDMHSAIQAVLTAEKGERDMNKLQGTWNELSDRMKELEAFGSETTVKFNLVEKELAELKEKPKARAKK